MKKVIIFAVSFILVLGLLLYARREKGAFYHVDYNGQKDFFVGAKDEYRAGSRVELYFNYTDTVKSYVFYLDDEKLVFHEGNGITDVASYKEGKGFMWAFSMPDHDISIRVEK